MLQHIHLNPAVSATLKRGQAVAPKAITLILATIALWLIAGAIWLYIPHPTLPIAALTPTATTPNGERPSINVGELVNRHLFGEAQTKAQPKQAVSDAPETRLNLTLAGIILYDEPSQSRALIANSNGKQKNYAIGDSIEGSNAEVHEIYGDRVVLERTGRYETLRLQKLNKTASSKNYSTKSPTPTVGGAVTTELKSVREEILKDPTKAGDFIRVRPVYSKGQLKGYRIYPGKNRALFRKVGLRSGDLVTAINSQSLNDPQKAFSMLSALSSATSISLELERRGRTETVSVDLDN